MPLPATGPTTRKLYTPRRAAESPLYRVVQDHLESRLGAVPEESAAEMLARPHGALAPRSLLRSAVTRADSGLSSWAWWRSPVKVLSNCLQSLMQEPFQQQVL